MFFGLNEKPNLPQNINIQREVVMICSNDMGKCRGQLLVDGNIMFCYLNDDEIVGDYLTSISKYARYDVGRKVTKCTAIFNKNTYCWYEE